MHTIPKRLISQERVYEMLIRLLATAVIVALAAPACGGSGRQKQPVDNVQPSAPSSTALASDGPLDLEEYYRSADALVLEATQRLQEVEEANSEGVAQFFRRGVNLEDMDDETAAAVGDLAATTFSGQRDLLESLVSEMGDLNVPPEVKHYHDEYVSAGAEIVEILTDTIEYVDGIGSQEELYDSAPEELGRSRQDEGERFEDACYALEEIADTNNVDTNLQCSIMSLALNP